jgi:hypothetical protein
MDTASQKVELLSLTNKKEILEPVNDRNLLATENKRIVRPIIGKIPQTQNSLAVTKNKEIKIQLFQSESYQKSLVTDAREYKILSAHFNNN